MVKVRRSKDELGDYITAHVNDHFTQYKEPMPLGQLSSRFTRAINEYFQYPTEMIKWLVEKELLYTFTTSGGRTLVFPGYIAKYAAGTYKDSNDELTTTDDIMTSMRLGYDYYRRSANKRKSEIRPSGEEESDYEWALGMLHNILRKEGHME